jgi:hypothetical protein
MAGKGDPILNGLPSILRDIVYRPEGNRDEI